MGIYVRRMELSDIDSVKQLIERTLRQKSMFAVYEPSEIVMWNSTYNMESFARIVEECHAYLLFDDESGRLLASGYIGLNEDRRSAHIGMVFTDYEFRNMGLGRRIIQMLEQDEFALTADRIELEAVLTAFLFYQKLGYVCRDNEYQIELSDGTYIIPMEKYLK